MAVINQIAAAVVIELNGTEFSMPFTAKQEFLPRLDLAEMKELHVTVVPKGVTVLTGSRAHSQHDYEIDVAVQKKAASDDEIDALMGLVDEIADHFRQKRLPGFVSAAWVRTENEPLYAQEHLEQLGQFTSVVTFTFRMMR